MAILRKRRRLLWLAASALLAAFIVGWWCGLWRMPLQATVLRQQRLDIEGTAREYRLVIPHSLDGQTAVPLVLAFPGAGDTPEDMAQYTQLDRLAASKGFLLTYLQGRHLSWPPMIPADNPEYVDPDLKFVDALCEELATTTMSTKIGSTPWGSPRALVL